jgi:hypothetical protein
MLLVEPRLCTMADCCGDEVGLRQSLDKISRFYRDAYEWNPPAIDVGERLAGKSMRQYVSTSRRFARGAGVDAGPSDGKNASVRTWPAMLSACPPRPYSRRHRAGSWHTSDYFGLTAPHRACVSQTAMSRGNR